MSSPLLSDDESATPPSHQSLEISRTLRPRDALKVAFVLHEQFRFDDAAQVIFACARDFWGWPAMETATLPRESVRDVIDLVWLIAENLELHRAAPVSRVEELMELFVWLDHSCRSFSQAPAAQFVRFVAMARFYCSMRRFSEAARHADGNFIDKPTRGRSHLALLAVCRARASFELIKPTSFIMDQYRVAVELFKEASEPRALLPPMTRCTRLAHVRAAQDLADVQLSVGDSAAAEATLRDVRGLLEGLCLADSPRPRALAADWVACLVGVARAAKGSGGELAALAEATEYATKTLVELGEVWKPDDMEASPAVFWVASRLADLHVTQGNAELALAVWHKPPFPAWERLKGLAALRAKELGSGCMDFAVAQAHIAYASTLLAAAFMLPKDADPKAETLRTGALTQLLAAFSALQCQNDASGSLRLMIRAASDMAEIGMSRNTFRQAAQLYKTLHACTTQVLREEHPRCQLDAKLKAHFAKLALDAGEPDERSSGKPAPPPPEGGSPPAEVNCQTIMISSSNGTEMPLRVCPGDSADALTSAFFQQYRVQDTVGNRAIVVERVARALDNLKLAVRKQEEEAKEGGPGGLTRPWTAGRE